MTTAIAALFLLSISALFLSIAALFAALRSSGRFLLKRFDVLSTRLSDLEAEAEANNSRLRSIRAQVSATRLQRAANSEVPEVTSETTDPEAAKDAWTRDMNLKIMRGEVRPFGRR